MSWSSCDPKYESGWWITCFPQRLNMVQIVVPIQSPVCDYKNVLTCHASYLLRVAAFAFVQSQRSKQGPTAYDWCLKENCNTEATRILNRLHVVLVFVLYLTLNWTLPMKCLHQPQDIASSTLPKGGCWADWGSEGTTSVSFSIRENKDFRAALLCQMCYPTFV